jgi:hypothetical protein
VFVHACVFVQACLFAQASQFIYFFSNPVKVTDNRKDTSLLQNLTIVSELIARYVL